MIKIKACSNPEFEITGEIYSGLCVYREGSHQLYKNKTERTKKTLYVVHFASNTRRVCRRLDSPVLWTASLDVRLANLGGETGMTTVSFSVTSSF